LLHLYQIFWKSIPERLIPVFRAEFHNRVLCTRGGENSMKRIMVTALSTLAFVLLAAASSFARTPTGPTAVPEPSSLLLLGTGVAGIWAVRKFRK
jgi:hypothetical protein